MAKTAQTKRTLRKKKLAVENDADAVTNYMDRLDHPLKKECEALRKIIKRSSPKLSERIKWNAPSYFYRADLVTFNFYDKTQLRLVFHHKAIVTIGSDLLLGDYPDRRLMYFSSMSDVNKHQKELERIIKKLITAVAR